MAETTEVEPRPRGSIDFAETSILDAIVPLESGSNIEEILHGSVDNLDESESSLLSGIRQRTSLYFGKPPTVRLE